MPHPIDFLLQYGFRLADLKLMTKALEDFYQGILVEQEHTELREKIKLHRRVFSLRLIFSFLRLFLESFIHLKVRVEALEVFQAKLVDDQQKTWDTSHFSQQI